MTKQMINLKNNIINLDKNKLGHNIHDSCVCMKYLLNTVKISIVDNKNIFKKNWKLENDP